MYYLIYIMHSLVIQIRQKYNKWMFSFCFFYYPGIFPARFFQKSRTHKKRRGISPLFLHGKSSHLQTCGKKYYFWREKHFKMYMISAFFINSEGIDDRGKCVQWVFSHKRCNNLLYPSACAKWLKTVKVITLNRWNTNALQTWSILKWVWSTRSTQAYPYPRLKPVLSPCVFQPPKVRPKITFRRTQ